MSIFFRKDIFNSDLNLESRKKIAQFEELKTEISIMTKQIGFKSERKLKQFTCDDNPKSVALEIREEFDSAIELLKKEKEINKHRDEKEYLKNLISVCEYFNIFVFEFIDRSRTPGNDIRFNGFYTHPNIIAIKRNQNYMKREIFTLAHELAHYLINAEEIDEVIESFVKGKTESWCNDFAFHFLNYENWDTLKEPCPALDMKPIKSKLFEEIVMLSYDQGQINDTQARKFLNSKNYSFDFNLY
jgi:Zn-dependent peptidase ImmA (M78 family)